MNNKHILMSTILLNLFMGVVSCLSNSDGIDYLDETGYMQADYLLIATIEENSNNTSTMHGVAAERFIQSEQQGGVLTAYIDEVEQSNAVQQHKETYTIVLKSVTEFSALKFVYEAPDGTFSKLEIEPSTGEAYAEGTSAAAENDSPMTENSTDVSQDSATESTALTAQSPVDDVCTVTIANFPSTGYLYNLNGAVLTVTASESNYTIQAKQGDVIYLINSSGVLIATTTVP